MNHGASDDLIVSPFCLPDDALSSAAPPLPPPRPSRSWCPRGRRRVRALRPGVLRDQRRQRPRHSPGPRTRA